MLSWWAMLAWPGDPQGEAALVRLTWYIVLVLLAALVDHAWLSAYWWAPDLSLALAAWAMVDGDEDGVVWRALLAGCARDLIDPAGGGFHVLTLTAVGILFLPLRRFLFHTRGAAWAVWACVVYLLVRCADVACTGLGEALPRQLAIGALSTATAAIACGWLLGGLPERCLLYTSPSPRDH
jgi:hypothetical protein